MQIDTVLENAPARLLWALLYLYTFAQKSMESVAAFFDRLKKAYTAVFRSNYYIFFEGATMPHSFYTTHYWASGSAAPELMYCADKKVFFPWIPRNPAVPSQGIDFDDVLLPERFKSLPYLSLEIVDAEGRAFYDLTDFLESLRYVALDGFPVPSLGHILAAWTLSSAVVPDPVRYTIRYIDMDGNLFPVEEGEATVEESKEADPPADAPAEESKEEEGVAKASPETANAEAAPAPEAATDANSETSTAAVISGGEDAAQT